MCNFDHPFLPVLRLNVKFLFEERLTDDILDLIQIFPLVFIGWKKFKILILYVF
jgi:hypothetical protein